MDVLLLTGAAVVTVYLSRNIAIITNDGTNSIRNVLGLALTLFALSVLEETQHSKWLVLSLSGFFTLEIMYAIVLLLISIQVLVILPCLVGMHTFDNLMLCTVPRDAEETVTRRRLLKCFKAIRCLWMLFSCLLKTFLLLSSKSYRLFAACRRRRRRHKQKGPILALTKNGDPKPSSCRCWEPRFYLGGLTGLFTTWMIVRMLTPLVVTLSGHHVPLIPRAVASMFAMGLVISAILNGFGTVSLPYECLAGLYLQPIPNEAILQAEQEVLSVQRALHEGKSQGASPTSLDVVVGAPTAPSRTRSKTSFTELGEGIAQRRNTAAAEVKFLETLVDELQQDVADMKRSQRLAFEARTPWGRVRSVVGICFSFVLLIRLAVAWMAMWPGQVAAASTGQRDPITGLLLFLTGKHVVAEKEVENLSQLVSLILTAFLSFSQVRTFLRTAGAVRRRLSYTLATYCSCFRRDQSRTRPVFASVLSHVLACLMGCYFVACVVLTKSLVPHPQVFFTVVGYYRIHARTSTVQALFAISALFSAFLLMFFVMIQRSHSQRQTFSSV